MTSTDTSGLVNPIIRGQLKDLPDQVYEATQRSHGLVDGIDFRPIDDVFTSRLAQWFMGPLALVTGGLSVYGFLAAKGLFGTYAVYEQVLFLGWGALMGVVAWKSARQAYRSAGHAMALKYGPHRLGLFLSPAWLLVHRTVDEVTFLPVSHIRSIEEEMVRSGASGSGGSPVVRVVYVVQAAHHDRPPLTDSDVLGFSVHLDTLSLRYIYDWWRDVQARRPTDS